MRPKLAVMSLAFWKTMPPVGSARSERPSLLLMRALDLVHPLLALLGDHQLAVLFGLGSGAVPAPFHRPARVEGSQLRLVRELQGVVRAEVLRVADGGRDQGSVSGESRHEAEALVG